MTLPSKELLSAVLNSTVHFTNQIKCADNELCISFTNKRFSGTKNYNIYELAIKTKQKYPDLNLNLAATDISEFWRQANELVRGANNE